MKIINWDKIDMKMRYNCTYEKIWKIDRIKFHSIFCLEMKKYLKWIKFAIFIKLGN